MGGGAFPGSLSPRQASRILSPPALRPLAALEIQSWACPQMPVFHLIMSEKSRLRPREGARDCNCSHVVQDLLPAHGSASGQTCSSPDTFSENWTFLSAREHGADLLEGLRLGPGREVKCWLVQMETAGGTLQSRREHIKLGGQETQNTLGG